MPSSTLDICGEVRLILRDADDNVIDERVEHNSITNWTRALIASFLVGSPITIGTGSSVAPSLPTYISLGTGTGNVSTTDSAMFAETYGMRKAFQYRSVAQGYFAQTTVNYTVNDPNGTFTEAGLWDQPVTTLALATQANMGAASISLSGSAPSMYRGQGVYIANGATSEYATLATNYNAGASNWTLNAPLKNTYPTSGTTVTAFGGNLVAHVTFAGNGVTKSAGNQLTSQWSIYVQAGGGGIGV